jgi:hypothetical protein
MKKLLITSMALIAFAAPSFAEQSNENMDLKEMRRAEMFLMKQMMEENMSHMKMQDDMMKRIVDLQQMIMCEDKNLRDGQQGCK